MSFWEIFSKDAKELFFEFDPQGSSWRVVTWNFDTDLASGRQWTVEIQSEKSMLIQWKLDTYPVISFFKNQKLIKRQKIKKDLKDLKDLMNLSIHSVIKHSIEINKDFMLTPVSGVTTLDLKEEARALQWIQASFGTLLRALQSFQNNKELILTGACFSGKVPDTQEEVLRVMAFNLDIFYYLRPDSSLHIVIFDDKDRGHGTSKNPSFQQIIKVTKPQFYDEIIKLLYELAKVGEIV